jgi:CDP-diacylglycerol--glycerol-3-phosphate 3-phosphatidyltransferase
LLTLPNQLSILRIVLSPVFLYLFISDDSTVKAIGFGIYTLATLTDWYDGWHARKYGLITRWGVFLDPFADKVLTSFAFILFYIDGIMPLWMVIIIVMRDIFITLLRSFHEAKGFTMKTSWIAKVKTVCQMTYIFAVLAILLFDALGIDVKQSGEFISFLYSDTNYYIMLFITGITLYTGVAYLFEKRRAEGISGDY